MDRPKLIIIHGLNNSLEAFAELGNGFHDKFQVTYLKLPQHGQLPLSFHFQDAVDLFVQELSAHLNNDTYILSYSLGCAYLQYALELQLISIPFERIIYLSPALKTKLNLALCSYLPSLFIVPSLAPRDLRFRSFCYLGQYQTLLKLSRSLKLENYPVIYADPQDELISLKGLHFHALLRSYLKTGEHHLTFHPRYFNRDEWIKFVNELKSRFLAV